MQMSDTEFFCFFVQITQKLHGVKVKGIYEFMSFSLHHHCDPERSNQNVFSLWKSKDSASWGHSIKNKHCPWKNTTFSNLQGFSAHVLADLIWGICPKSLNHESIWHTENQPLMSERVTRNKILRFHVSQFFFFGEKWGLTSHLPLFQFGSWSTSLVPDFLFDFLFSSVRNGRGTFS